MSNQAEARALGVGMDVDGLREVIRREVAERGWSHVEQALETSAFLVLARALGTMIRCLDVVVDARKEQEQKRTRKKNLNRPSLYQAEGFPMHTDPPDVDILALHCVVQDLHGGDNQLIDVSDLDQAFEPEEIECLGRVEVAYA